MEWKEVEIEQTSIEIIDGDRGKNYPKNNELSSSGYCLFLSAANVTKSGLQFINNSFITKEKDALLRKGKLFLNDIVLTTRGTVGNVGLYSDDVPYKNMRINSGMVIIRPGKDFDTMFLYQYLRSCYFRAQITQYQSGSAQPQLPISTLQKMNVIKPNIAAQRRIASVLSSLDRKIELNNKINADLEEMAQAIFKNWLSECSDEVNIGELSLNVTNYEKTDAEEVVLINSSDVTEGYFDHHNYSPNKNLKGHFKKRFQKGDILYSQVRPRNRHWAYCNFDANDYLASTQLMVIRNNPSLITSILLYQYIISDNVWKEFTLKTETRSGTFPQGNYEDLSQIRVPYDCDVKGISNQLETLYAKMFMLKKENSRLSLLRDTLLPRLMSGEIEVPE